MKNGCASSPSRFWKPGFIILLLLLVCNIGFESHLDQRLNEKFSRNKAFPWQTADLNVSALTALETRIRLCKGWDESSMQTSPSRLETAIRGMASSRNKETWPNATLAIGVLNSYKVFHNTADLEALRNFANQIVDPDGNFLKPPQSVQSGLFGWVLLDIYALTGDKRYKMAADHLAELFLTALPRSSSGTLPYDKAIPELILVDTIGMICPFLARYGRVTGSNKATNLAVHQLEEFFERGIDSSTGMPWHAYRSDGQGELGALGWTRGAGWLAIGVIETLAELNPKHPKYEFLLKNWTRLAGIIKKKQRLDGLWSWVMADQNAQADTSGSGMLAFSIQRSISCGILPNTFQAVVDHASKGLIANIDKSGTVYGALGECQGVGHYQNKFGAYPWGQGFTASALAFHRKQLSESILQAEADTLKSDSSGLSAPSPDAQVVDICVYGATPAGITAAVAAKQEGRSVLLIEPSRWVGGMLGAGIKPKTDCANENAVGGLTKSKIFSMGNTPPIIRNEFSKWLEEEKIPVVFERRVQRVEKRGNRIESLILEYAPPDQWGVPAPTAQKQNDKTVKADVFIDASYEGDLMAGAGVKYAIGRESCAKYDEEPAGVCAPTNWTPIDPYIIPGVPESGLLPMVDPDHGKKIGEEDDYTQAYNFRFYLTGDPLKWTPFGKPPEYDPLQFELVGRLIDLIVKESNGDKMKASQQLVKIFPGMLTQGEFNYERSSLISNAPVGISRYYQDGNWERRSKIWRNHIDYLRGLHYFLSTDPRVPEGFRRTRKDVGLDKTMFPDTQGWPNQLYIRVTRRMRGPYILTHADVLNQTQVEDAIGLALYGVDIYPVRRYVTRDPKTNTLGVATEGDMFLGGQNKMGHPYAVPYRAIIPKAEECTNLIVPVCISASYIAYASVRMEPVFAILGESAGVAAAHASATKCPVQAIDVRKLQQRLRERGQILEWKP
ncbi:MAG: FAD-dependent oxidoreductase [Verrucomicrobiota bacterium]